MKLGCLRLKAAGPEGNTGERGDEYSGTGLLFIQRSMWAILERRYGGADRPIAAADVGIAKKDRRGAKSQPLPFFERDQRQIYISLESRR